MSYVSARWADTVHTKLIGVRHDGLESSIPPGSSIGKMIIDGCPADGDVPAIDPLVIADYVSPAPMADDVRAEASRRIQASLPMWKQNNLAARSIELLDIATGRALDADEQAEKDAIQAAWDWVKSVRAASDLMEPAPPVDFADDIHWPVAL